MTLEGRAWKQPTLSPDHRDLLQASACQVSDQRKHVFTCAAIESTYAAALSSYAPAAHLDLEAHQRVIDPQVHREKGGTSITCELLMGYNIKKSNAVELESFSHIK